MLLPYSNSFKFEEKYWQRLLLALVVLALIASAFYVAETKYQIGVFNNLFGGQTKDKEGMELGSLSTIYEHAVKAITSLVNGLYAFRTVLAKFGIWFGMILFKYVMYPISVGYLVLYSLCNVVSLTMAVM